MTDPAKELAEALDQERRWRAEEKAEEEAAFREAKRHRDDCLCRAVWDWSPGPACFQNVERNGR